MYPERIRPPHRIERQLLVLIGKAYLAVAMQNSWVPPLSAVRVIVTTDPDVYALHLEIDGIHRGFIESLWNEIAKDKEGATSLIEYSKKIKRRLRIFVGIGVESCQTKKARGH